MLDANKNVGLLNPFLTNYLLRLTKTLRSANIESERVIRPLQTEYWGRVWTCSAWCELRGEFRAFRVDRVIDCRLTGESFDDEPGKTIQDYLHHATNHLNRYKNGS